MNILHIILAHWIFTFYSAKFQKRAIGHFRLPIICWKLIRVNGILRLVNGVRWGFDLPIQKNFGKLLIFTIIQENLGCQTVTMKSWKA